MVKFKNDLRLKRLENYKLSTAWTTEKKGHSKRKKNCQHQKKRNISEKSKQRQRLKDCKSWSHDHAIEFKKASIID